MVTSTNNTVIFPGSGTFTDTANNVYSITTGLVSQKNKINIVGGTGTDKLAWTSNNVWGHDSTHTPSTGWYELVGTNWIGPSANVVGSIPPVTPPPVTQPPVVLNDTLTVIIAGTTTNNVNPKFIVALGANGDIAIPPTPVTQNADNVNWQTFTFKGNWPSPQTGYLTFVNSAPNRELVVKSISFDSNTYVSNGVVILSQQGQSASFQR